MDMSRPRVTLLLGLFRENRFSYARATIVESINTSFLNSSVADDLRCYERIDSLREVEVEVPGEGKYVLFSVCLVDRAVFNGFEIALPTAIHVAETRNPTPQFEAYIGRDLINYWQLYVDPAGGVVRSRVARRARLE